MLVVSLIILCAPFGFGVGWLIGRRLSAVLAAAAAIVAVIVWFYLVGILLTRGLSNDCTDCNPGGWAFLVFDPIMTIGFIVGLLPGVVIDRRTTRTA